MPLFPHLTSDPLAALMSPPSQLIRTLPLFPHPLPAPHPRGRHHLPTVIAGAPPRCPCFRPGSLQSFPGPAAARASQSASQVVSVHSSDPASGFPSSSTLAGPTVCSQHSLTMFPSSSPLFLPLPCCPLLVLQHSRHSPTSRTCTRSSLYSDTLPSESHMTSSLTSFSCGLKSELPRDTLSARPRPQHSSCPFAVQRSPSPSSPADVPRIFMFDQFLCLLLGPYSKRTGVSLC